MPAPTLRDLKLSAQKLNPTVHLGKAGLTPQFLAGLEGALAKNALIKMRFDAFKDERKTLAKEIAEKTGSTLVQQIGHTAVFYRPLGEGRE